MASSVGVITLLLLILCSTTQEAAVAEIEQISYAENGFGLDMVYDATASFIDLLAPWDQTINEVQKTIGRLSDQSNNGHTISVEDIFEETKPVMAVSIGPLVLIACCIAFMLFVPLIGLIFCCCRCCNACGGKRIQKSPSNCCCVVLTIGMVVVFSLMTIATAWIALNAYKTKDPISQVPADMEHQLDDILKFIDESAENITAITVGEIKRQRTTTLQHMESTFGDLRSIVMDETPISTVQYLNNHAADVRTHLQQEHEHAQEVIEKTKALAKSLKKLAEQVKDAEDKQQIQLKEKFDFSEAEQSVNQTTNSTETLDKSLQSILNDMLPQLNERLSETKASLDSMLGRFDEQAQNISDSVGQAMLNGAKVVNGTLRDFREIRLGYYKRNGENFAAGFRMETEKATKMISDYWLLMLPVVLLAVILLCLLSGLCLACCGYNSKDSPSERSNTSNHAGNCLMAGVGFAVIFSFFLMLITVVLSFVALVGNGVICKAFFEDEMADGDVLRFIDQHQPTLDSRSYQPHISKIYGDCKANKGIFEALQLSQLINVTELAEEMSANLDFEIDWNGFSKQLSNAQVSPSEDNMKYLSSLKVTLDETRELLYDFNSSANRLDHLDGLDRLADEIKRAYDKNPTIELRQLKDDADRTNAELKNLQEDIAVWTLSDNSSILMREFARHASEVKEKIANIPNVIAKIILRANNSVLNETKELKAAAHKLIIFITKDASGCYPMYQAYSNFGVIICKSVLNPIHGIWFPLFWALVLFIPAIIFAVRLAKYLRRMNVPRRPSGLGVSYISGSSALQQNGGGGRYASNLNGYQQGHDQPGFQLVPLAKPKPRMASAPPPEYLSHPPPDYPGAPLYQQQQRPPTYVNRGEGRTYM